jgi:hypothetical protein
MAIREIKALKFGEINLRVAPNALNFFEVESEEGFYQALDSKTLKDGIHSFYIKGFATEETGEENLVATKVINNTLYKIQANLTTGDLTLKVKEIGQTPTSVLLLEDSNLKTSSPLFTAFQQARTSGFIPYSFRIFPGSNNNTIKIIYEHALDTSQFDRTSRVIVFTYTKTTQTVTSLTLSQSTTSGGDFDFLGGSSGISKYYEGINDIYLLKAYLFGGVARQFLYAIKRNEVLMSANTSSAGDDNYSSAVSAPGVQVGLSNFMRASLSGYEIGAPDAILKFVDNEITYDVLNIWNKSILISTTEKRILEKDRMFLGGNTFIDPRFAERKIYTYNYTSNTFTLVSTIAAGGLTASNSIAHSSYDEENQKIYLIGYKDSSTVSWFVLDLNGNIIANNTFGGTLSGVFLTKTIFNTSNKFYQFDQNNTVNEIPNLVRSLGDVNSGVSRFTGKNNYEYILLTAYQTPGTNLRQEIFVVDPNGTISFYKKITPSVVPNNPYNNFGILDHYRARSFSFQDVVGQKSQAKTIDIGEDYFFFKHNHGFFFENFENALNGEFGLQDDNTSRAFVNNYAQSFSSHWFNYVNNDFVSYFENEVYVIGWDRKERKIKLSEDKITFTVKSQIVIDNAAIIDL